MTTEPLVQVAAHRPLVLDGALATFLRTLGGEAWPLASDALSLTNPRLVRRAHDLYCEAGADIIRTNSFQAAAAADGRGPRIIARAAADVARAAADDWTRRTPARPRFVAGTVGPVHPPGLPLDSQSREQLREAFREVAAGLLDGGVDALIFETWTRPVDLELALVASSDAAADRGRAVPVVLSLATPTAQTRADVVDALLHLARTHRVWGVGINCGRGPSGLGPVLASLESGAPVVSCCPSAGLPDRHGGYPVAPELFAETVSSYVTTGQTSLVGGCCGTTPAHIRALADAVAAVRRAGTQ